MSSPLDIEKSVASCRLAPSDAAKLRLMARFAALAGLV
jgi:hypothetical protein